MLQMCHCHTFTPCHSYTYPTLQICYLTVRIVGHGPPQVNTGHVVVKGADKDLPMYRIYGTRCRVDQRQQGPVGDSVVIVLYVKKKKLSCIFTGIFDEADLP